jgi:hypothetical protein
MGWEAKGKLFPALLMEFIRAERDFVTLRLISRHFIVLESFEELS